MTKYNQLNNPPPPLFIGQQERDLVKMVNDEVIERIIGQEVVYYPISLEHTNFHPLYGEAINKTYLPPIHIHVLVEWNDNPTTHSSYGIDKASDITIHFHKRRLIEDQDVWVREGDIVAYGADFYEIITLVEPKELFGNTLYKMEISAKCVKARQGFFDGK